jgi:hypothetical protein
METADIPVRSIFINSTIYLKMAKQSEEMQYNSAHINSCINQEFVDKSRGKNILNFFFQNHFPTNRDV